MKKKNLVTWLAVLLLITIVIASIVAGTYARYANTVAATATATSAAWSFAAGLGNTATTTLNLYNTIPTAADTYPNLKANTIAPGTSGSFDVVINGTGSEVGIKYIVNFAAAGENALPSGLTFKVDGTEIAETTYIGYIAKENVGTPVTKTVTWEWTYGDVVAQDNYDEGVATGENNTDAAKEYLLDVTIRGEQYIGIISVEP